MKISYIYIIQLVFNKGHRLSVLENSRIHILIKESNNVYKKLPNKSQSSRNKSRGIQCGYSFWFCFPRTCPWTTSTMYAPSTSGTDVPSWLQWGQLNNYQTTPGWDKACTGFDSKPSGPTGPTGSCPSNLGRHCSPVLYLWSTTG